MTAHSAQFAREGFTTAADRSTRMVETICGLVADDRPVRILDIGCGDGETLTSLTARLPLAVGHGVDISVPSIAAAEQRRRSLPEAHAARLSFRCADVMEDRPEDRYDVVCMDSVLHLLPRDDATVVAALADLLAPGGVLVHNTPDGGPRNLLLRMVRGALAAIRNPLLDAAALRMARLLHGSAWSDEALRERLVYAYMVPPRLYDRAVRAALENNGLAPVSDRVVPAASPAQLRHTLSVWRRS